MLYYVSLYVAVCIATYGNGSPARRLPQIAPDPRNDARAPKEEEADEGASKHGVLKSDLPPGIEHAREALMEPVCACEPKL